MSEQGPGLQAPSRQSGAAPPPPVTAREPRETDGGDVARAVIALRFGPFELDLHTSELRRAGLLVKLQQQPARVLAMLALRQGELVLREDIRRQVWGADTFVDFDQGLNFCIRQVRAALCDQAGQPHYVETLPRRGYRFLADVERVLAVAPAQPPTTTDVAPAVAREPGEPAPAAPTSAPAARAGRRRVWLAVATVALTAAAWAMTAWRAHDRPGRTLTTGARKASVVVLPFDNMTGDSEQEYLSDGLTEELITQLARLSPERLAVIARTSSMSYKGRHVDVRQVARELHVDYVLEGSLRRADGRVRVTAQLIQASDQTHLWAGAYDDETGDALSLQSDVSRRIVSMLTPHLVDTPAAESAALAFTPEPAAYDAYLRGRHLWGRRTPEALAKAREWLERAVLLDPGFASAHTALARNWLSIADRGLTAPLEAYPQARAAAQRALELDSSQAEAHLVLGVVKAYYQWDLAAGYTEFQVALRLEPGSAEAHHALGDYYSALGRHDQAIAAVRRAIALDPVSVAVRQDLGWYLFFARRHDEAADAFRQALEFDASDRDSRLGLSLAEWQAGKRAASVREHATVLRELGAIDEQRAADLMAGEPLVAHRELLLVARERALPLWGYMLPAMLGERERTLAGLEAAVARHNRYVQVFVASDPRLDFLRSDARFQALQARIGLSGPAAAALPVGPANAR